MRTILIGMIAAALAFAQLPAVPVSPLPIIIDGEFGEDISNADGLYIGVRLHQLGYLKLLGVLHSTGADAGPGVVRLMLDYADMAAWPIGAYQGSTGLYAAPNYASLTIADLTTSYAYAARSAFQDATTSYRKILALQPNASVTIICIGTGTNLSALLQSSADALSSLTGLQLVTAKVTRLVWMGGTYPSGSEHNFTTDATAASYVALNWPTPIVFDGYEVGNTILIGADVLAQLPANNPLSIAHTHSSIPRPSWDANAVMYTAIGTASGYYSLSANGTNTVDGSSGANSWASSPQSGHYYVIKARPDADILALLNSVLYQDTKPNPRMRSGARCGG